MQMTVTERNAAPAHAAARPRTARCTSGSCYGDADRPDGVSGYGEAAPLQPYDGVSIARVRAALEAYRPVLMQSAA